MSSVDTLWVLIGTVLVFFMQAGFASLETGLTQSKNSGNIIMKNVMDFVTGSLLYWFIGFGIMFGPSIGGIIGSPDFFVQGIYDTTIPGPVFLMFQTVFAATAATIVSGAMAERTKFSSYLIYTVVISGLIYPISGHWIWGGGWLAELGFVDFAGSVAVHMVGGVSALVGAIVVGPRLGKFDKEGKARAIPGHNLTLAALGVFILWFAWFGFNGASTLSATGDDTLSLIGTIFLNTNLAAVSGTLVAMTLTWVRFGKPDVSVTLNGTLAGLVGITAGCAVVSPFGAVAIGILSSTAMVYAIEFVEQRLKIDDPVGAFGVHGISGALGTILVGLFSTEAGLFYGGGFALLGVQAFGVFVVALWVTLTMFATFKIISVTVGLRVTEEEEILGLDISEHGLTSSYGDFVTVPFEKRELLQNLALKNESPELAFAGSSASVTVSEKEEDKHTVAKTSVSKLDRQSKMTKVEIIMNKEKFEDVKSELNSIGITGMTVTKVYGYGIQKGKTSYYRGVQVEPNLLEKLRVETVVSEVPVEEIISTLRKVLSTGKAGDGKIFIHSVENAIRISTGEEGTAALRYDNKKR
ncbi:ammonium transporter [Alkalibacterium sp. 20]|uniref:ammonium transporter n=1 Tax=Alkalibacterium sp. 20 TaxID=1798803 RepID=UPI0008FFE7A0|nr:ammonium transporter [Alkalibacterium sp. 20]OJF93604.1 adenylate cyclase [Alkalibacterium sp. 20]